MRAVQVRTETSAQVKKESRAAHAGTHHRKDRGKLNNPDSAEMVQHLFEAIDGCIRPSATRSQNGTRSKLANVECNIKVSARETAWLDGASYASLLATGSWHLNVGKKRRRYTENADWNMALTKE
jgi:hypothetical protein